jgi:hypothetical protein
MIYFHRYYNLFDVKLIIVTTLFLLFLIFWLVVLVKGNSISRIKFGENEFLMNLRMQNSLSISIFLIAISIPFVVSGDLVSDWSHVVQFAIGILMVIIGFVLWIAFYEPRYKKLENFYLNKHSKKVPE